MAFQSDPFDNSNRAINHNSPLMPAYWVWYQSIGEVSKCHEAEVLIDLLSILDSLGGNCK